MGSNDKYKRNLRQALKSLLGGCCIICGYNKHLSVLEFHHINPSQKVMSVSRIVNNGSPHDALQEALKCVLVCKNCHAELEVGLIAISKKQLNTQKDVIIKNMETFVTQYF